MERPKLEKPPHSRLALALAVMLGIAAMIVLFFLTLGFSGPLVVIGGLLFAVAALHYLVWGWWLGRMIRSDVEAEESNEPPQRD